MKNSEIVLKADELITELRTAADPVVRQILNDTLVLVRELARNQASSDLPKAGTFS